MSRPARRRRPRGTRRHAPGAGVLAATCVSVAAALVAVGALAGANTVPATAVDTASLGITANDLKPSACASLNLSNIVVGTTGTLGNDLLLGTPSAENLDGDAGDDCVLGGDGNDSLRGGLGTDVCIGGPGNDSFPNNPLTACETQIQ